MLRPHGLAALVLIGLLLWLTPAAYADPPDPTWIGGYWDDDDFDNVVVFLTSALAIHAPIVVDAEPMWIPTDRLEPSSPTPGPFLLHRTSCPRAPPV